MSSTAPKASKEASNDPEIIDFESSDEDEFADALQNNEERDVKNRGPQPDEFSDVTSKSQKTDPDRPFEEFQDAVERADNDKEAVDDPANYDPDLNEAEKEDRDAERRVREEAMTEVEREELRKKAQDLKKAGNDLYLASDLDAAVRTYTEALDTCPLTFEEDRSVYFGNRSAAYVKMVRNQDGAHFPESLTIFYFSGKKGRRDRGLLRGSKIEP